MSPEKPNLQYRKLSYDTLEDVHKRCHAPLDPQYGNIMIDSCRNGLNLWDHALWNPTTAEGKLLTCAPSIRLHLQNNRRTQGIGFGFDTKTMDHKVVTFAMLVQLAPYTLPCTA